MTTIDGTPAGGGGSSSPATFNGSLVIIDQFGKPIQGIEVNVSVVGTEFALASYVNNLVGPLTTDANGKVPVTMISNSSFSDGSGIYEVTVGSGRGRGRFRVDAPTYEDFEITQKP